MLKWRIAEEKKAQLSNSYHELQEEGIVMRERLRGEWKKEIEETIVGCTSPCDVTT